MQSSCDENDRIRADDTSIANDSAPDVSVKQNRKIVGISATTLPLIKVTVGDDALTLLHHRETRKFDKFGTIGAKRGLFAYPNAATGKYAIDRSYLSANGNGKIRIPRIPRVRVF